MGNSPKVKEVLKQIHKELMELPTEELRKQIDDALEGIDPAFVEFCSGVFPCMDEMAWFDEEEIKKQMSNPEYMLKGEWNMDTQNIPIDKGYFVAGEDLKTGDAVYIDAVDGKLKKAKEAPSFNKAVLKTRIKNVFQDAMKDLLLYRRQEDTELPVGAIEKAIQDGVISTGEILTIVRRALGRLK